MTSDNRPDKVTAETEGEMLRRYAEHTGNILRASAILLAEPVMSGVDMAPAELHARLIRLVGEFSIAAETLAAWIIAFRDRGTEAPSLFDRLVNYGQGQPMELWNSVVKDGWDRALLRLPDDDTLRLAMLAEQIMERPTETGDEQILDATQQLWEHFDKDVCQVARHVTESGTALHAMYRKSKHGFTFTWNYEKYGSSLLFVDGANLNIANVPISPGQAESLRNGVLVAARAIDKLSMTAFSLAATGLLYPTGLSGLEGDA